MSAEEAYARAQAAIAKAKAEGATELFLDFDNGFGDVRQLPPELAELTDLTRLDVDGTQVEDLEPLSTLTALRTLYLSNTPITSLEHIGTLTALQTLYLNNTPITSLEHIGTLTALGDLVLENTKVSSLDPIRGMVGLRDIRITGSAVNDLRPILDVRGFLDRVGGEDEGIVFAGCAACELDPDGLGVLAEIEDHRERTEKTLEYLRGLTEWPPEQSAPEETGGAGASFGLSASGKVTLAEDGLARDPDQDFLQDECREKVLNLIEAVGQTNEHGPLVSAAEK